MSLADWVANVVDPDMAETQANVEALRHHLQAPMLAHWGWAPDVDVQVLGQGLGLPD